MNTTVRRHPRTTAEAFPTGAEYGCAIEAHRPMFARSQAASAAIAIVLMFAAVVVAAVIGMPQP